MDITHLVINIIILFVAVLWSALCFTFGYTQGFSEGKPKQEPREPERIEPLEPYTAKSTFEYELDMCHDKINELVDAVNKLQEREGWYTLIEYAEDIKA